MNDAPVAGNDRIVTNNVNVPFTIPTWALMADDTDPDGPALAVTAVSAVTELVISQPWAGEITITDTGHCRRFVQLHVERRHWDRPGQCQVVRDITNPIGAGGFFGGNTGDDILVGDGAASTFEGYRGDDIVFAGAGDDTISWTVDNILVEVADGRDFVDGGEGAPTALL